MICGRYYLGLDHIEEAEQIRTSVFDAELGQKELAVTDETDEASVHAVVYTDLDRTDAAAVGRLHRNGDSTDFCLDRLAVKKDCRGNGYGDFIVRMLVDKGLAMGADRILVDSPLTLATFFQKIGFHFVDEENNASNAIVAKNDEPDSLSMKNSKKTNSDHVLLEIRQNQICKACKQH